MVQYNWYDRKDQYILGVYILLNQEILKFDPPPSDQVINNNDYHQKIKIKLPALPVKITGKFFTNALNLRFCFCGGFAHQTPHIMKNK